MTYYSELASLFVRIAVNLILIGTPISLGVFIVLRITRAASPRARYLLTVTAFFVATVLPLVLTVALTSETSRHPTILQVRVIRYRGNSTRALTVESHTYQLGKYRRRVNPILPPSTFWILWCAFYHSHPYR